jgi:hypothetical protein
MKIFLPLLFVFTNLIFAQNEDDLLKQFSKELTNANEIVLKNDSEVEKSIIFFENQIKSTSNLYLKNCFLLHKAKEERRLDVKKAITTLNLVQKYLNSNPEYFQLKSFYNSINGRILFEAQKDCDGSYNIYNENIDILNKIKKPFLLWNVTLETKTGIINSLLCLQKDIEALEYLKQLEKEINPKTQLKEYIYVISVSGYINTKLANYKEGEKYFVKVINLLENNKEHQDNYLSISNNLAHVYKVTEQTDKGIALLEKALLKAKQLKDVNNEYLISNNLGFLYVKKERYKDAEKLGLSVLKNASEKDFGFHIANANRLLGTVYYNLANYKNAEKFINNSIDYYRDFKNPELLRQSLDVKNKLLIKTNQFESAAKVNSEIISLLDSVSLNTNIQSLQKNLIEYETEKKDAEITILKQKEEIQTFELEKNKQLLTFSVISLILIVITSLIVFFYQKKINTIQNLALRSKLTRSQFNPHYINNAFTSLQATLIENDLDESLINYTSDISRFSRLLLESTFKDEWTLFEEKQMMEHYLKTQQHRYEHNFEFSFTNEFTNEELHKYKLPSALTQTVLENAIEHGGYQNNKGGKIEILIQKMNNQFEIAIKNNKIGTETNSTKKVDNEPSRGLEITKQRMELHQKIHKTNTDFRFEMNENEVLVTFVLPLLNI